MKPHVICHMATSLDGRILPRRWRPADSLAAGLYEKLHEELDGDAWLVGRTTGQEFARAEAYARDSAERFPRESHLARRGAGAYAIVTDAQGRIGWGRGDIGGDPLVVLLAEQVPDAHLAGLRRDGVSYLFAGAAQIDLRLALDKIGRELGVKRLLLEGGGVINGALLRAGLVDEVSLILCPAIDGVAGAPCLFDSMAGDGAGPAPLRKLTLTDSEAMEGGALWLRYRIDYEG
jgi:riboflavin biosynthesis pyrimidine reductase